MRATRACATIGPGSAALCKARPFVLQEPLLLLLLLVASATVCRTNISSCCYGRLDSVSEQQ
jgi:hypothetical protein